MYAKWNFNQELSLLVEQIRKRIPIQRFKYVQGIDEGRPELGPI